MNIIQLKYVPINGLSEVMGMIAETVLREIVRERRMVTPKESFSPESGGKVKPNTAIEAIRTQGTIKLKK
jgi:hypothetical protein